jgi:hypothetical protein
MFFIMENCGFVNNPGWIPPIADWVIICFIATMMGHLSDTNNQLEKVNQLPPKKRLDYIIDHPVPMQLVRSMATPDLLLTIRQLGFESSLELIEMMHKEQVQELFDLELWHNDELNIKTAGAYISLLLEANRDTAIAQLHGLDIEFIGLMFKMVTEIYDTSLNEEPIDFSDLHSTSPDGRFIVCFIESEGDSGLAQALHAFLQELYGRDLEFALRLLETLRYELPSSLEETCLRWRQNRLLELGVLPREERLEFFAPLTPTEIRRIVDGQQAYDGVPKKEMLALCSIRTNIDDKYVFLKTALAHCSDEQKELFWLRLRHAVINMHASLSGDFGDEEEMAKTSEYIKFLAELGLMQLCQGQLDKGAQVIDRAPPKYLIRLGRTALIGMRKRLLGKKNAMATMLGKDFCYADSPLREVARAASLPEPRFYEGLLDVKKLGVRFFASLIELNATINAIHELIFRADFVAGLGVKEEDVAGRPLAHAGIFARVLVNSFMGKKPMMADIKDFDVHHIMAETGRLKEDFTQFARAFTDTAAEQLAVALGHDVDQATTRAQAFLTAILIQLEQNPSLLLG